MPNTLCVLCLAVACACPLRAQQAPASNSTQTPAPPRRTRLFLKDGTYQLVLSYKVSGNVVHYVSAERNGASEDIPLALVDLPATEAWAAGRTQGTPAPSRPAVVLSPELAKEEAELTARTPEVAPDLHLPEEDAVVVLDRFHNAPELVPLSQNGGDLNKETAHNVLPQAIPPASSPHRLADIPGTSSDLQLHTPQPVFYVRVGKDDAGDAGGHAFTVDTHGKGGRDVPSGGDAGSDYVLEQFEVHSDLRVLNSFRFASLGVKPQAGIIEMKAEPVQGGHWMKLTPAQPLEQGEYALIEITGTNQINLAVWDFGINPAAKDNAEAIHPEVRKPMGLERRNKE